MAEGLPEEGWYADPEDSTRLRWWDGLRWGTGSMERPPERAPTPMPMPMTGGAADAPSLDPASAATAYLASPTTPRAGSRPAPGTYTITRTTGELIAYGVAAFMVLVTVFVIGRVTSPNLRKTTTPTTGSQPLITGSPAAGAFATVPTSALPGAPAGAAPGAGGQVNGTIDVTWSAPAAQSPQSCSAVATKLKVNVTGDSGGLLAAAVFGSVAETGKTTDPKTGDIVLTCQIAYSARLAGSSSYSFVLLAVAGNEVIQQQPATPTDVAAGKAPALNASYRCTPSGSCAFER